MNTNNLILIKVVDLNKDIYLTDFNLKILSMMRFRRVSVNDILNFLYIDSYGTIPSPKELYFCIKDLRDYKLIDCNVPETNNDKHLFYATPLGDQLFSGIKHVYNIKPYKKSRVTLVNIILFLGFVLDFLDSISLV